MSFFFRSLVGFGLALAALTVFFSTPARAGSLNLQMTTFATGLASPVDIKHSGIAGDPRLFVVQKGGLIKIVQSDGSVVTTPFLDIDDRVNSSGSEEGLLGLAFHPSYASNRFFYVFYTNSSGNLVISRFTRDAANANLADPNSELNLLTISHPTFSNHNGGDLNFGPLDGYLYIGTGDGGSGGDPPNNAQNKNVLLGKILRIDVNNPSGGNNYGIPAANPFVGQAGTRGEIFDYGLRNPWRFNFDRSTKQLWIADVGQSDREEVNIEAAGSNGGVNYGWRCYEGTTVENSSGCGPVSNYTFPIAEYDHSAGKCSVTGGYVYRGSQNPNMVGHYFFADYCTGHVYTTRPNGSGGWITELQDQFSGINFSTFGEDIFGELYAAGLGGTIYKVGETPPPYRAQYVRQSGPITVGSGDASGSQLYVDYKNTGSTTWSTGGANPVRLGTNRPRDRASLAHHTSWISSSRAATFAGKVDDTGTTLTPTTSIAPNETARFQFTINGPPSDTSRTVNEYFELVAEGNTWFGDIGQYFPITVTGKTYAFQYMGQTAVPAIMAPGQRFTMNLDLKNTGTATWRRNVAGALRVGTSHPMNRASAFMAGSNPNAWVSNSRVTAFAGRLEGGGSVTNVDTIAPNETARFTFDLIAPQTAGTYTEYLQPLVEGYRWLNDIGIHFQTTVPATDYDYQYVAQANPAPLNPATEATAILQIKNTGRQTWSTTGSRPLRLGTERPKDRSSVFYNTDPADGWISASRIKLTRNITDPSKTVAGESTVAPGEIAEFEFKFAKNSVPVGQRIEYFAPVAETFVWLRDIGIYFPVTVQ